MSDNDWIAGQKRTFGTDLTMKETPAAPVASTDPTPRSPNIPRSARGRPMTDTQSGNCSIHGLYYGVDTCPMCATLAEFVPLASAGPTPPEDAAATIAAFREAHPPWSREKREAEYHRPTLVELLILRAAWIYKGDWLARSDADVMNDAAAELTDLEAEVSRLRAETAALRQDRDRLAEMVEQARQGFQRLASQTKFHPLGGTHHEELYRRDYAELMREIMARAAPPAEDAS